MAPDAAEGVGVVDRGEHLSPPPAVGADKQVEGEGSTKGLGKDPAVKEGAQLPLHEKGESRPQIVSFREEEEGLEVPGQGSVEDRFLRSPRAVAGARVVGREACQSPRESHPPADGRMGRWVREGGGSPSRQESDNRLLLLEQGAGHGLPGGRFTRDAQTLGV